MSDINVTAYSGGTSGHGECYGYPCLICEEVIKEGDVTNSIVFVSRTKTMLCESCRSKILKLINQ